MKRSFVYICCAGLFAALPGCKKYLEKEPDNRTNITSPAQIGQLLTSAYPKGNYILFCEAMSDNVEDRGVAGVGLDFADRINAQSYRFQVVEDVPDDIDGPTNYWNSCYKAIAVANQALEIIRNSPDSTSLSAYKGEALLARAYAHFMLVTLFSKPYNPVSSSSDPGIPFVTEPETETFKTYERKTVSFVYEMVEKDLTEGYPLINDQIYTSAPRFHFNKRAAAAFAARFYLFKQDYNQVVSYATTALGTSVVENLRPWNTVLTNLQYAELEVEYTKSTTEGNLLLQEAASIWGRYHPSFRFGLGPNLAQKIFFTDNVSGGFYAYDLYGTTQAFNLPKFSEYFVRENLNANSGIPYNTIPLLTGEEALLNRAEAYLRLNNNNAALADLNSFASENIDEYDPTAHRITASKASTFYNTSSATGILNAILDFKQAFFLLEGLRWFDIIRLGIPVQHVTSEGEVIQVLPDDNRRVLQLPVTTRIAGLEPNPR